MEEKEYTGYRELILSDNELCDYYSGLYEFPDMYENEYGLIINNGKLVEKFCYMNDKIQAVRYPTISDSKNTITQGRNEYQNLAIDLLQRPTSKVKLITGLYGSGKDYLMMASAMSMIEKNKFKKLIFIRPNITVANQTIRLLITIDTSSNAPAKSNGNKSGSSVNKKNFMLPVI